MDIKYTVEELMLNDSFIDYCRNRNSIHKDKWEKIISQHPDQLKIIEEARQLLWLLKPDLSTEEIFREINIINEIITAGNKKNSEVLNDEITVSERLYVNPAGKLRSMKFRRVFAYTSVIAAMLCGVWYLISNAMKPVEKNKNSITSTTYQNLKAERKSVELPDGSIVILNSNSQVSIPTSFNVKDRIVQLSGEAFFKVKKNVDKPFIVMNTAFSTTALGTSFYVHARNNKSYSVDLLEGRIKLEPRELYGNPAYLIAGEEAQWLPVQARFTKDNFDTIALKQWLNGKISFNKTPLKQALNQLENWYAVDIEIQRSDLKNAVITGDYINVPLDDVLKVICFSLTCKYRYSGTKIIIE